MYLYLNFFVGIEEHDADEGENFLSGTIARSCEMWQRLDDCTHVVQFYLSASNQHHLPAIIMTIYFILGVERASVRIKQAAQLQ